MQYFDHEKLDVFEELPPLKERDSSRVMIASQDNSACLDPALKGKVCGKYPNQVTMEFVVTIDRCMAHLPEGRAYLINQLQRASSSILLNISEGAGELSGNEKIRFYRMARRSATECAGILDLARRLVLLPEEQYDIGRKLLIRIVSMLSKMVQISNYSQTATQTQTFTP